MVADRELAMRLLGLSTKVLVILASLTLLVQQTSVPVLALSSLQRQAYNAGLVYFDTEDSSCSGSSSSISVPAGTLPTIIPEPYNGAFTLGATKHNVAPALIAALFSEEHALGGNTQAPSTDNLARAWANFVKQHPDPNSGWATSGVPTSEVWPDGKVGAGGPFQFEPSTWTGLGYDTKDRDNLVVAAAAAAKYAQTDKATVDTPEPSWKSFIFSYNHADWYVNAVLKYYDYYNSLGNAPAGGSATTLTISSGGCAGGGAVNCDTAAASQATSGLSQTRQNAVCIAQAELQKWSSGQLLPADGFLEYSQNIYQEWCADFVSWVYEQAHYPLHPDPAWRVASVAGVENVGQNNQNFHWHNLTDSAGANYDPSYVPKPGDLAIHRASHVNMVVAVKGSTVTLIGGDQTNPKVQNNNYGTKNPPSTSIVSTETVSNFTGDGITGYVSPD